MSTSTHTRRNSVYKLDRKCHLKTAGVNYCICHALTFLGAVAIGCVVAAGKVVQTEIRLHTVWRGQVRSRQRRLLLSLSQDTMHNQACDFLYTVIYFC